MVLVVTKKSLTPFIRTCYTLEGMVVMVDLIFRELSRLNPILLILLELELLVQLVALVLLVPMVVIPL